jgi:hypothetical protein
MDVYKMRNLYKYIFIVLIIFVSGCSSTNPTLYKYRYYPSSDIPLSKPAKIFLTPFNLMVKNKGVPEESVDIVNKYLHDYLGTNNYEVLPQKYFVDSWNRNLNKIGGLYDPMTGRFSRKRFDKCLEVTASDLSDSFDFSYIVFPDLIVKSVKLNKYSDLGDWHGVTRHLPKNGVYKNGWRAAKAASIMVTAFTKDKELHFQSVGGLDFIQISTKEGRIYKLRPRKNLFANQTDLAEGVNISLHPFVAYKDYPKL